VIGAYLGGKLGITGVYGPMIDLKGEAIGLGIILELPMVIVKVQRGGPSTGLPKKTEQADLLQAYYGRNGEAPLPIVSASTPSDCFNAAYEACRIALEHMTPVFLLSDGYIANGSEPWKFPKSADLPSITPKFVPTKTGEDAYLPYKRDENLVRDWAVPGMAGYEHRIGGLEKEVDTGNVSYDPDNHEKMVKIRAEKVAKIADSIPLQVVNNGAEKGDVLLLSWGSTYGVVKTAVKECNEKGLVVGHIHLTYLSPFPKNLGELLKNYTHIIVPEINNGQLVKIIRDEFLVDAKGLNKIKGIPFSTKEIVEAIEQKFELA